MPRLGSPGRCPQLAPGASSRRGLLGRDGGRASLRRGNPVRRAASSALRAEPVPEIHSPPTTPRSARRCRASTRLRLAAAPCAAAPCLLAAAPCLARFFPAAAAASELLPRLLGGCGALRAPSPFAGPRRRPGSIRRAAKASRLDARSPEDGSPAEDTRTCWHRVQNVLAAVDNCGSAVDRITHTLYVSVDNSELFTHYPQVFHSIVIFLTLDNRPQNPHN